MNGPETNPDRGDRPEALCTGSREHRLSPGHGWPRDTQERDEHFVLDMQPSTGAQLDRAACDFWDSRSAF